MQTRRSERDFNGYGILLYWNLNIVKMEFGNFSFFYQSSESGNGRSQEAKKIGLFIDNSPYIGEETAILQGFAATSLVGTMKNIIRRLGKASVEKWRDRIFREKGLPSYSKLLESQSLKSQKLKLKKSFLLISQAYSKRLCEAFTVIQKYIRDRQKGFFLIGLYRLVGLKTKRFRDSFYLVKQFLVQRTVRKRYVKERISWAIMVLLKSKGLAVKKCLKRWEKWTNAVVSHSKVTINVQIHKYKVKNI